MEDRENWLLASARKAQGDPALTSPVSYAVTTSCARSRALSLDMPNPGSPLLLANIVGALAVAPPHGFRYDAATFGASAGGAPVVPHGEQGMRRFTPLAGLVIALALFVGAHQLSVRAATN